MGLRIATNVASLNSQRNLRNTRRLLDKSLTRLSSGYRINRAGDDAAGLAISEKLRAKNERLSTGFEKRFRWYIAYSSS